MQQSELDEQVKKAMSLIYEMAKVNNVGDSIIINACVNIVVGILLANGASSESVLKMINIITDTVLELGGNAAPVEDFKEKVEEICKDALTSRKK